jgi:outer membrane protein assembly factor BamA
MLRPERLEFGVFEACSSLSKGVNRVACFEHRRLTYYRNRALLAAAATLILAASAPLIHGQESTTLRKVEIIGLQRLSVDQVLAATGLKVGDQVDRSTIDNAAAKLQRSGWFKSVDYRVRIADNESIVVFEVAEKVPATDAGAAETLGQVAWSGNTILTDQELSGAFGLRTGEPAPQTKVDQGIDRVRKAYARRGYLGAGVSAKRDLAGQRVNLQITVSEGPQHRMGVLTIAGLNAVDTRYLREKWTLAPDAVFDDSYPEQFTTTVIRPFIASRTQRTGVRSKFEVNTKPDAQKQSVDVIITFK